MINGSINTQESSPEKETDSLDYTYTYVLEN